MNLSLLEKDQIIFKKSIALSQDQIACYLDAVGDKSTLFLDEAIVPPMAILAQAMAEAMAAIKLPPGTVHTSQDLEVDHLASVGASVECTCAINSNTLRSDIRFLVLEFKCTSASRARIFVARPTLVVTE